MKSIRIIIVLAVALWGANTAQAHQPRFVSGLETVVSNPDISQAFYAELNGEPHSFLIESGEEFELFVQLLVPAIEGAETDFSADVFQEDGKIAELDAAGSQWDLYYEEFGGDHYFMGPEFTAPVPAGNYRVVVRSPDNTGKYVFVIGKKEVFTPRDMVHALKSLPRLKSYFEKPRHTALFNTSGRFLLLTAVTPIMLLNGEDMQKGRKEALLGAVMAQLGAIVPASESGSPGMLFTSDPSIAESWSMNRSFFPAHESAAAGAGPDLVKARGGHTELALRAGGDVQIGFGRLDFAVNGYANGVRTGYAHAGADVYSLKAVSEQGRNNCAGFGMQARYLDNRDGADMRFVDIFTTAGGSGFKATAGVTWQTGDGLDSRAAGFGNAAYDITNDLAVFAEYSGADYFKAIHKHVIHSSIGSAADRIRLRTLSAGLSLRLPEDTFFKLAVYDAGAGNDILMQINLAR